ncbi:MAG: 8-amino-7-oxononanoate synthase [Crocinitomicaceae bacterium]|nr:8-amino-7-oxononanoate synthase [Crocinitomicaceae bacterium]
MKRVPSSILDKLSDRKKTNAYRSLMDYNHLIDFYSNDYLGVAKWNSSGDHPQGSTGSRLISGNFSRTEEIEQYLAGFFGMDSGILFNSGYDANLGLLSALGLKGDTILYDEYVHASIRDGIRMGNASAFSFYHNDVSSLKDKLGRAKGNKYVVIETVYSMDGDQAPLKDILHVCEQFDAYLIVDEAHSGGIYGTNGRGIVSAQDLNDQIFAKVITFGKAYGSHGAVILGGHELRAFLINFSRSLIYTTALSPHSQERIYAAVNKVAEMDKEREILMENIMYFKEMIKGPMTDVLPSNSPIQSLMVPGNESARKLADKILEAGFAVKAILSPTVPAGKERLRFCLHSYNTAQEIRKLVEIIHG